MSADEMAQIARGHLLTVAKGADWDEEWPHWEGEVTCLAPSGCGGWWECHEPHRADGRDANSGPYDCADDDPWCGWDEYEFHGVPHTWRYSVGWTVPYKGCVVQTSETICDDAYEIGQQHGSGVYVVDDEWGDPGECTLLFVRRADVVNPPARTPSDGAR